TRDLLLQVTPFWMEQPSYLIVTAIALLSVILFSEKVLGFYKTLLLFDTIGLGLFVVVGLEKSLNAGFPFWVCIIMGTITGSVGGVIRDVLINEIPLLFRRDIYALACVFGGIGYYLCHLLDLPKAVTGMVAAGIVILTRIVAVKYHIQVPTLKSSD
nr:TRIC cation channel family protein [Propionivibrio sp.]